MTQHTLGLMVGGLLPALIFGFSNLFIKASTDQGIGLPMYVIIAGVAVTLAGLILLAILRESTVTVVSGGYAFAAGFAWAMGIFCVTYGLQKYGAPISQLTPLFNMNTLVAVLLALWVFAEWRQVQVPQLVIGSALIVVGGTLVARA